ncbi:MAG TPA: hypothetical protein VET86_03750, partial [Casimicrobiaceae bacterium]|nr:hypothetical protein [Casimicrobiaceae bacterium]
YPFKQRLGSTLHPVWLYFRHRNPVLNWIVGRLMAWLSVKPEEIARVDPAAEGELAGEGCARDAVPRPSAQ